MQPQRRAALLALATLLAAVCGSPGAMGFLFSSDPRNGTAEGPSAPVRPRGSIEVTVHPPDETKKVHAPAAVVLPSGPAPESDPRRSPPGAQVVLQQPRAVQTTNDIQPPTVMNQKMEIDEKGNIVATIDVPEIAPIVVADGKPTLGRLSRPEPPAPPAPLPLFPHYASPYWGAPLPPWISPYSALPPPPPPARHWGWQNPWHQQQRFDPWARFRRSSAPPPLGHGWSYAPYAYHYPYQYLYHHTPWAYPYSYPYSYSYSPYSYLQDEAPAPSTEPQEGNPWLAWWQQQQQQQQQAQNSSAAGREGRGTADADARRLSSSLTAARPAAAPATANSAAHHRLRHQQHQLPRQPVPAIPAYRVL